MVGGLHDREEHRRPEQRRPQQRQSWRRRDLNDPNNTRYSRTARRERLERTRSGCRAATTRRGTSTLRGSLISNTGYPYVSTYLGQPDAAADADARQPDDLPERARGRAGMPTVTLIDLGFSRRSRSVRTQIVPRIDFYNPGRVDRGRTQPAVGGTYRCRPRSSCRGLRVSVFQ